MMTVCERKPMSDSRQRRRVLELIGTGAVVMVAGCLGGDDDDSVDDDSVDGSDHESSPSGGTDSDENTQADADADDGIGEDFTPGVDDAELEEVSGDVYFADVIDYESSFVADLWLTSPDPATGFQKVHGEDFYVYIDGSEEIEMYGVDGDLYTVVMGYCDLERRDPEEAQYVPVDQSRDDEYAPLPAAGTTTIHGEQVYVFEHHITTEYLSTTTGYPVRSEWPTGRADYHSWGEVEPISPPDRPCEET